MAYIIFHIFSLKVRNALEFIMKNRRKKKMVKQETVLVALIKAEGIRQNLTFYFVLYSKGVL